MINKLVSILKTKKYFSLKSQGTSMLPILRPDDVVYFRKISFHKIKLNDFLVIKKRETIFTHRVIYKGLTLIVTKGDNNLLSDGKIYPRQIIGKVYQVKRNGKIFNPEDPYLIQSSLYFTEIVKIKKALETEKIDFVFLKGLPLHLFYEGSHPRRIYADCDVLIKPNNLHKLKKILLGLGYQSPDTSYSSIHKILKDKPTEAMFVKKLNGFPIIFDVHFEVNFLMNQLGRLDALYPQNLIDKLTGECFKTKISITVNGEKFLILDSYFLILYLALHFFHHNYRGIFRLEFIHKIIRKSLQIPSPARSHAGHLGGVMAYALLQPVTVRGVLPLAPGVFLALSERIKKYQLQNFVYPVFLLLEKYYDLKMPKVFLDSIKPTGKKLLYIKTNILKVNIFDDEPRIKAGINRFRNLFFLSPYPLLGRLLIVFNPQVIYSALWTITSLAKRSLIKAFRSS